MAALMPAAGRALTVDGGEKSRASSSRAAVGRAWKPRSMGREWGGAKGGRTRAGSMVWRDQ
jgi:hypothetical protein